MKVHTIESWAIALAMRTPKPGRGIGLVKAVVAIGVAVYVVWRVQS